MDIHQIGRGRRISRREKSLNLRILEIFVHIPKEWEIATRIRCRAIYANLPLLVAECLFAECPM